MKKYRWIPILVSTCILFSCKEKSQAKEKINQQKDSIKYAKGFNIKHLENEKVLHITQAYPNANEVFSYNLVTKKTKQNIKDIQVPVKRIVVNSTTHIPMLELLDEETTLVGFQNTEYVSSEKTRALINSGKIRELGLKAELNTEVLFDVSPEVVVGFAMSANNKTYQTIEKAGIPVVYNGDWLETSPLGRAEWIKFFGVLYNKEKVADSIFSEIERNYLAIVTLAKKATEKPTVLSGAIMSKDIWNLPAGDSFVAQFLKDANTDYLWKNTAGTGSLSLSFESVYAKAKNADFWIAPGYFESKEQLLASNEKYAEFNAFKTDNIYTFANKKGNTGGVIYYELAPVRPDLVLKDILKITHPKLLPNYELTFFEKMK